MNSHYRTLGVDSGAEHLVIRSAYRALIRRYHPDGGGKEADPARAQAVTAAWEVLRDPERRAAYDDARQARFEPGGIGGAIATRQPRARGGAAARNLFLLLFAGTIGLGWWALQQPHPALSGNEEAARVTVAATPGPIAAAQPAPVIRPPEDEQAARRRIEEDQQPQLPEVRREPEVEVAMVVVPPLAVAEPARLSARSLEGQARRPVVPERTRTNAVPAKVQSEERPRLKAAAPTPARLDLAPLERHLQLLTDQSLRFGTEAKRARLFATGEGFMKRLRECDDDACRRDTYLRRNAEVAEIMRN